MNGRKILIVEDEVLIARDLQEIVQNLQHQVVGAARCVSEALSMLQQHLPDLVLIDITLRGELDGIDLAGRLRAQHNIPFIFITSLSDTSTVTRATQTRPHGYLVKPFQEQDVFVALEVAFAAHTAECIASIAALPVPPPDSIFVRDRKNLLKIDLNDLLWVQADDTYTHLHAKGIKYTVGHTLKYLEERLPAADFVRVHKSYLVAIRQIASIDARHIVLQDGKIIPLGRVYQSKLLTRLNILESA